MPDQTIVYLGNRDAVETRRDDSGRLTRQAMPPGKRCTTVTAPAGMPLPETFLAVTAPTGVWAHHSAGPPAWVASTSPVLAQLLAAHYGCEVRDPEPADDIVAGTIVKG